MKKLRRLIKRGLKTKDPVEIKKRFDMYDTDNSGYIDRDELYRHLRRDHFFCHFCDSDGQQFYFA